MISIFFCCKFTKFLIIYFRPVLDEESGMVTDFQQLEEINKKLSKCTDEPYQLPPATEQMINDMKADGFTFQTPPSSPSSLGMYLLFM